jgi:hypothetical protein
MDIQAFERVRGLADGCASTRRRPARRMHPGLRVPSTVHHLQESRVSRAASSQCPKIMAPIVNMAAPIQIRTAAFFSEMIGVDFMTK